MRKVSFSQEQNFGKSLVVARDFSLYEKLFLDKITLSIIFQLLEIISENKKKYKYKKLLLEER
ncbi:TPA: hypothetical protein DEG21_02225 [Patescibacteria group bacterium]|nr:hypothetical protein [Candidatus Gracilibacteria bacterium]